MEECEIKQDHGTYTVHEISVDWNGFNFLIIYGKHINGWFIAIPNWKICVEATEPTNIYYNIDKLSQELGSRYRGKAVANAVREHWEGLER